jgi:IclR helix-turn-helix domain
MQQFVEALEAERAGPVQPPAAPDGVSEEVGEGHGGEPVSPAPRSLRRATARRASTRRATARQRKDDIGARIIDYLGDHPTSTAGDVAKALNANRSTVATRLSQMVQGGEVTKLSKGYAVR